MASVLVQANLAASQDEVWQLVADFGGLMKFANPRMIKSCTVDGFGVGAVRTIETADGGVIRERLESLEPHARRLAYSIVGESPLPLTNYMATMMVTGHSNGCQIDWVSTFEPRGVSPQVAEGVVRAIYEAGIAGIRRYYSPTST